MRKAKEISNFNKAAFIRCLAEIIIGDLGSMKIWRFRKIAQEQIDTMENVPQFSIITWFIPKDLNVKDSNLRVLPDHTIVFR